MALHGCSTQLRTCGNTQSMNWRGITPQYLPSTDHLWSCLPDCIAPAGQQAAAHPLFLPARFLARYIPASKSPHLDTSMHSHSTLPADMASYSQAAACTHACARPHIPPWHSPLPPKPTHPTPSSTTPPHPSLPPPLAPLALTLALARLLVRLHHLALLTLLTPPLGLLLLAIAVAPAREFVFEGFRFMFTSLTDAPAFRALACSTSCDVTKHVWPSRGCDAGMRDATPS